MSMVADFFKRVQKCLNVVIIFAFVTMQGSVAHADLRVPTWYNNNIAPVPSSWHYRVPISIPSGNYRYGTVKVDVDFNQLLTNLGVVGTFDVNSPRVVTSSNTLATTQEFTDRIYGGATDPASNGKGEVRFLLDADAVGSALTYYLYFDVTQNGSKAANPQTPINGNFEKGANGTAQPLGWNAPVKANAVYDASVRATEAPLVTASPTSLETPATNTPTDGTPLTGDFSYLYGYRTTNANPTAGTSDASPGVSFSRDIVVPATNPGSITFRYRPEGFDSGNYDYTRIDLATTANVALVEMVGPTAATSFPATSSYALRPFSPASGGNVLSAASPGYRAYNTFDCKLNNSAHTLAGMVVPCRTQQWITVTQSLAAYAGTTIRFRVRSVNDIPDQTWYSIDDVEWSVAAGSLGTPEAFGVNITTPAPGLTFLPGQPISIAATVDAAPTASSLPVTASLYDTTGALIAGGPFLLYNDGTHGDVTAGDSIWTNNGAAPAQPAPTLPFTATTGTGYTLRVFARDATTSTIAASANGLAHILPQPTPETQANFWNVDEILFNVQTAAITVAKSSTVVSDPINGTTNQKIIPGALVQYCLIVTNAGPLAATNIIMSDPLPPELTYAPGTMKSGPTCLTATTAEDDNNTGTDDTDTIGASFSGGSVITISATLASGASMALIFNASVK